MSFGIPSYIYIFGTLNELFYFFHVCVSVYRVEKKYQSFLHLKLKRVFYIRVILTIKPKLILTHDIS